MENNKDSKSAPVNNNDDDDFDNLLNEAAKDLDKKVTKKQES